MKIDREREGEGIRATYNSYPPLALISASSRANYSPIGKLLNCH